MRLNKEGVKNDIREKIKKFLERNKNELTTTQNLWDTKGSPEREVHSDTGLPKKDRNISNKRPTSMPTRTGGTTANNSKQSPEQREERK